MMPFNKIKREWADYGFDQKIYDKIRGGTVQMSGENPIIPSDGTTILENLYRLPSIGENKPTLRLGSAIQWGEGYGALRVVLSPIGSLKATVKRQINDLEGHVTWICKQVFPITNEVNEEYMSNTIYEAIEEQFKNDIDSPKNEYKEFERLANYLINNTKRHYPSYCMFPVGFKEVSKNYFKMIFEFKGHGVETPTVSRAEQFNIDLIFYPNKGLIRCYGYNIDSKKRVHNWKIQPSEWDEYFSPTQEIDEIVESIKNIFSTY